MAAVCACYAIGLKGAAEARVRLVAPAPATREPRPEARADIRHTPRGSSIGSASARRALSFDPHDELGGRARVSGVGGASRPSVRVRHPEDVVPRVLAGKVRVILLDVGLDVLADLVV